MLEAILFDLDGTLIDSAPTWRAALVALAEDGPGTVDDDLTAGLEGLSCAGAVAAVHARLGWSGRNPVADAASVEARVCAMHRHRVRWRPGAMELVREVQEARILTGLVTSSSRDVVGAVLAGEAVPRFDVVVCGEDAASAKPDPAPYLTAARALGLRPASCVAIEDSGPGTASAVAAGCHTVLACDEMSPAGEACLRVRRLSDLEVDGLVRLATRDSHRCRRVR